MMCSVLLCLMVNQVRIFACPTNPPTVFDQCFDDVTPPSPGPQVFDQCFEDTEHKDICMSIREDLLAIRTRDAACTSLCHAFL